MEALLVISGIVILILLINLATANARADGYREALEFLQVQRQYGNDNQGHDSGIGFVAPLVFIMLIVVIALILYLS